MIEFTLSKLNLLVFVLAVTAIVIFFMNTINSNLRTRQAYEIVYKVGQEIKIGVDNPSYCSVKYAEIPKRLQINHGFTSSYNIDYLLNISAYDIPENDGKQKMVLAILDSRKKNIYAAYDLDFNGIVHFYYWEYNSDTGKYTFEKKEDENYLDLAPDQRNSIDQTIVIAKKIRDGQTHIHLFACGRRGNIPGCSNHYNDDFIKDLVTEQRIDCICMSDTLARKYGSISDDGVIGATENKIEICQ